MNTINELRERRLELGLTMKYVASKTGVNEGTVSRWETGDIRNIRSDKIQPLAEALKVPIETIIEWKSTKPSSIDDDSDMQALFHIKNVEPSKFEELMKYVKNVYKLDHPDDGSIK